MFNFIKKWLLRKELSKIRKGSVVESALDDYIGEAMKEHASASRMADKILKAKILHQQTKQTLSKIKDLDDEYENDEEIEEAPSIENKLLELFMGKMLGSDYKKQQPQLYPDADKGLDEFGEPKQQPQHQAEGLSPNAASVAEAAKKLPKSDIEELKRKFFDGI